MRLFFSAIQGSYTDDRALLYRQGEGPEACFGARRAGFEQVWTLLETQSRVFNDEVAGDEEV